MIITKTPLRISFVGGGTDLKCFYKDYGGAVVNAAIDKYVYIVVKKRLLDNNIMLNNEISICPFLKEAIKIVDIKGGIDVHSFSDLPQETGLGSSGSYLVGLLNALYTYKGELVHKEAIAEEACKIEIDILKMPVGKQDQYIAAFGGLRYWEFKKDNSILSKKIGWLNGIEDNFLLIYIGITRKSSSILKEQVKNVKKIVPNLIRVRDLAKEFCETGDFTYAMNMGWEEKKHFAHNITNSKIENLYNKAIKAGALAGKIVGAGGGGFLLFNIQPWDREKILKSIDLPEIKFEIVENGSRVIFNER